MMILPLLGFSQINEGFEGASFPPTTPGNWAVLNNGVGTGIEWAETTNAAFVHSGTKAAIIDRENIGAGNTSQDWLITPQVTLPANGQLRFWTRQTLIGNNGSTYEIRVSTDPSQTNQAAFTTVATWNETDLNATYNVYEEKLVSLSTYSAGTQVYIAFVKINTQPSTTTSGDRWIIDDVNLVQQCSNPSILTSGATTVSTAVLGWQENGTATTWDIYYNQQADPTVPTVSTTPNFSNVTNNPFTATGLAAGTAFKFWVRSVCTPSNVSSWVGPFNFVTKPAGTDCTGPIVITGLPYSHTANTIDYGDDFDMPQGSGCAGGTINYMQGPEAFYSFTPSVSGNITISMTPTGVSSSLFVYNGCANVGVSCLAGAADTTANPRNIATLSVTAGQTYIIVVSSSSSPATGIPYTLIIQEKFCDPPTNGTTANPTTNSIEMTWANPSGATSWQVTVQAPGAGVPTTPGPLSQTTNDNTNFVFGGLAQATAYEYWVRADCGGGLFSPWAGPYRFNTSICDAVDKCNYTFIMTDSGGNGWQGARMEIRQNGIVVQTIGSTFTAGAGPISISVPLCENYPFELYWTLAGTAQAQVGIAVRNNTPFNQILYTKAPGTGSAPSLLFSTSFDCQTPACLPPTAIADNTPTTQGATISWTPNGGNAWDIYVVPFGSPAPTATSTPTFTAVTTNPFILTGLQPNKEYQYYVRTNCSSTSASVWTSAGDFTTLPTCSKPINLTFSNVTASSAVLDWTQPFNPDSTLANQWQVILLPCSSPVPDNNTPGWITINSKPFTALGLSPLTCYDYYVRAVCSPTDFSPISLPQTFETPDINDECVNSKLVPVNQNTHCTQTTLGSLQGATASTQAPAPCTDGNADNDDVWFHFTATATTHYISFHLPALTGGAMPDFQHDEVTGLSYALYSGTDCGNLIPLTCHDGISGSMNTGLTIGQTYKIRVFSTGATASNLKFEVCVGTRVIYCENAVPICLVDNVILRNDVGVPQNPNPISGTTTTNVGCLGSAPSPTFYYLTIPTNGSYTYHITQGTSATNTPNLDVDYATWGPYPDVATACSSISVNNVRAGGQTVGCSFSPAFQEDFAFPNAIAGEVYVVMVTNYTASSLPGERGYIKITKTSGPQMQDCCPYTSISYSSNFYCKDDPNPAPILGQSASFGTFSATPNTLVIDPITGVIDLSASPVGTYLITSYIASSDPDCNPSSSTWTITITNPPSATIVYSASEYCTTNTTTQTVTQTGTTGGYYLPVPNIGLSINPVTGAFTPSTSIPGTYIVNYRIPASGGCDLYETSTTVIINKPAVADFNYGTGPYCSNGSFAAPVFTGGGVAGTFTSTPGLVINSATGEIDLGASVAGTYIVTNEIGATGGCALVTATSSITITSLPVATFNYAVANHCQSEGTLLPTFIGGGLAGTFSSSTGLVINSTTGEIDLASSIPGAYTVYNTIVAANGCPQVQEQFDINVYANPVATILSSDLDNTICAGQSATLTVNPTNFAVGDATYVWLLNTIPIPGATSYQYSPTTTGLYEVLITLNSCTNVTPITTNFTVNFVPQATIDGTNLVKCVNEVSVITVTPINYTTADPVIYSWTLDGSSLPDTTNSISYDDYGIYEVTITNQGCSSTYSISVSPDTTEIPIDAVGDCQGSNYILTASPINGSFDPANVLYEWTNSNGDIIASGNNQNTFNVSQYVQTNNISSGSFPLTFTVKVTTSPDGCTDTQDFLVLSSICTIPKGISPNGDGKNDSFDLRGLGVKQLSIFNRYGTKVYSYSNYTDQWHGQTDKGDELPVGTYYFVFEQNDGQNKSGWIYINK